MTPIALAVTASSAFPGFFPSPLITAEDLGLFEGEFVPMTFTDGGAYDNLGVRAFDAGPEKLKPVARRVPPDFRAGRTSWQLEFDLSDVRIGNPADLAIEATNHDFERRKGKRETWLRYSPPC